MPKELSILLNAVQEAGAAILKLQKTGFTVAHKANKDIVTQADLLANDIIKTSLKQHFPEDGWLSEECVDDESRFKSNRVWIVDPIDGTRDYAQGLPEYAISVALVEKHTPTMAVVFNPATNELFHAIQHQGAWLNQQKIHCGYAAEELFLLASRSEQARGEWDVFAKHTRVKAVGSIAYKLALVAAGRASATFSLGEKNEWDIAAGVLLVTESQGIVTDKLKNPILFNQKIPTVNGVVASTLSANEYVFSLIEDYSPT